SFLAQTKTAEQSPHRFAKFLTANCSNYADTFFLAFSGFSGFSMATKGTVLNLTLNVFSAPSEALTARLPGLFTVSISTFWKLNS
ncbi:hypothetical protein ABTI08_19710, partial [Acinetobacter baumannii]